MDAKAKKIISAFEDITAKLSARRELFDQDNFLSLENIKHSFENNIEQIVEENRVLRIGIVGEVKAGKSSFLNALIFGGQEVLPKAATAMTAALTKISYGEKFAARIVFYDKKDWRIIEERSDEYDQKARDLEKEYRRNQGMKLHGMNAAVQAYIKDNINELLQGCKEITQMVRANGLNPEEYFGKKTPIECGNDPEGFFNVLKNYVGVNGKFTPLVKYLELTLNLPMLKDIELIDTPGINDPIVSRGNTTRNFISSCDVIFFMSYAGEFLSSQDVTFLTSSIPESNVSEVVLIGSRFDEYVLDTKRDENDLISAMRRSKKILDEEAVEILKGQLSSGASGNIIKRLYDKLPPVYISSIFYTIAKKQFKGLDTLEVKVLDNYKSRFVNFRSEADFMISFSNIENIRKKVLDPIRERKEEIIAEKIKGALSSAISGFLNLTEKINIDVQDRHKALLKYDKTELEDKYSKLKDKLDGARSDISMTFSRHINSVNRETILLKNQCEKAQSEYSEVEVKQRVDQTEWTTGFWFWKKTHVKNTTVNYVDINQITKNLHGYILFLKDKVIRECDRVIDIATLKKDLKSAIIEVFDLSAAEFRESEITGPVELVLGRIIVPKLNFNRGKYEQSIVDQFSGGIAEGMDIHSLMHRQSRVLDEIFTDLAETIDSLGKGITSSLEVQSAEFIDNIQAKVGGKIEAIKAQISEKEAYCGKYESLEKEILEHKLQLRKLLEEK